MRLGIPKSSEYWRVCAAAKRRARLPVQEPAREALMTLVHAEPGADTVGGVLDTVSLSGGRALTIRTVTRADIEGLDALFEGALQ